MAHVDYHYSFRVVLVGDTGVGKSELLRMHTTGPAGTLAGLQSLGGSKVTVGINIRTQTYENDGHKFRVHYWDAPGAERFVNVVSRYCTGAAGIIFVYDVSNFSSFTIVESLLKRHADLACSKVLVGNKSDVDKSERQVPVTTGEALAKRYRLPFFETSAHNEAQITEPFSALLNLITDQIFTNVRNPSALARAGIDVGALMGGSGPDLEFPKGEVAAYPDWLVP